MVINLFVEGAKSRSKVTSYKKRTTFCRFEVAAALTISKDAVLIYSAVQIPSYKCPHKTLSSADASLEEISTLKVVLLWNFFPPSNPARW